MAIRVPNYVLTLERSRLTEFFLLFSRFEFALKAAGYAKAGRWGAEVNWDKFSKDSASLLLPPKSPELCAAIEYLTSQPPKQQKYQHGALSWEDRLAPQSYSAMRGLLFYVAGVRNNLVHGAKFLAKETDDPRRDEKLLDAAGCIISACLDSFPKVYRAFDSEAL